jgi:hypothetical protein
MFTTKGIISATLLCLGVTLGAATSKADTTYTYTGADFDFFLGTVMQGGPFVNVTGSFTLPTPLAANEASFRVLAFSFSSGPVTITDSKSVGSVLVNTDAAGVIDGWDISIFSLSQLRSIFSSFQGGSFQTDQYTEFGPMQHGIFPPIGVGADHLEAGIWTASTTGVPEPSSLAGLGVGLFALVGLSLRKCS